MPTPDDRSAAAYYDADEIGARIGLRGTGIIGHLLGDQLHPPMVDDDAIWADPARWREGAEICVRRLGELAGVAANDLVLDIGCGVGGPTRQLARETGCRAFGLNVSTVQLQTAVDLLRGDPLQQRVSFVAGGMERMPLRDGSATCAMSFNMFYHVSDKTAAIREVARVLRLGGRFAFDDWVLTPAATPDDVRDLQHHWGLHTEWIVDAALFASLESAGLRVAEVRDYANVGRGPMKRQFGRAFETSVRPLLRGLDAAHGDDIADSFRDAVDQTIALYDAHKLRYLQLVAVREER